MADGEPAIFSSFSESDGDSIPSGSVCYSTDLTEDSKAISDVPEAGGEVLLYRFEPERCSMTYSESEEETEVVTDSSREEQIGNADWYMTQLDKPVQQPFVWVTALLPRGKCSYMLFMFDGPGVHVVNQSMLTVQESVYCQEVDK